MSKFKRLEELPKRYRDQIAKADRERVEKAVLKRPEVGTVQWRGQLLTAAIATSTSEKEFQALVEQLFRSSGFLVYHTHDSRRSERGFPDLVAANAGALVIAELKMPTGTTRPEQRAWLRVFTKHTPHVFLWRPTDAEEIVQLAGDLAGTP